MDPLVIQLRDLLPKIHYHIPESEFRGIGVIVYRTLNGLPIASLCPSASLPSADSLAKNIALCSLGSSSCHDGFQLVSDEWKLTLRNQYFAPSPNSRTSISLGIKKNVGSRYMAARLGSSLEQVVCTGLVSNSDGLIIFADGDEV